VRRLSAGFAAAALTLLLAPAAEGALRFKRCGEFGFRCARLSVPLDRSGAVPGNVSLFVKRVRARRRPARGATFLLAGGPGQSASAAFAGEELLFLEAAYRRRDLIVFDQRGTGRSGLLRCPPLERANILDAGGAAADCAARLGPQRAFYRTQDTVEDIEAVRRELGTARLTLFGTSYGTKVALAYALQYPHRVERLVLDSVVEAAGPDALYLDTFEAVPRALRTLCRAGCRGITRDPVADVEALVARLAAGPLPGGVYDGRGRRREDVLDRADLFAILVSGDFDPVTRAGFPAAVRSALAGDTAPVLRLKRRAIELESPPPRPKLLSAGVYAATTCEEVALPWDRGAPFEERRRQAAARAGAVPPDAFRPFDRLTALDNDLINLCERWPAAPQPPILGPGPLPDVPVLLLEGEDDLRTPVENARRVAALFPRSRLYVAPATGHSALGSDFSGCAQRAFDRFLLGRRMPRQCRRVRREPRPIPIAPTSLARVRPARGVRGRIGRALRAVLLTLDDVVDDYSARLLTDVGRGATRGGGLRGGSWLVTPRGTFVFKRVTFVPGLRVSGRVERFLERDQRGRLRIRGPATPNGTLVLRGRRVRGRLGRRRLRGQISLAASAAVARAASRLPGPAGPLARRSGR
jgi:pimeloyl-ACP methyl ester carboxylesterase